MYKTFMSIIEYASAKYRYIITNCKYAIAN